MKDISGTLNYKDHDYKIVFNFNVMEAIQDEYGTVEAWGELTDGTVGKNGKKSAEPNAKAVIFGIREMLNEGIDIENDKNGTDIKPFTLKQVGRMLTEIGLQNATSTMNEVVVNSTKSEESDSKNA